MGKITGFLEIERQDRKYTPAADRVRHYNEFVIPHELRHSVLSQRLPGEQPDPRLE